MIRFVRSIKMSDDLYEYAKLKPAYNVQDVAATIFSTMIEQEMGNWWFIKPEERRAMIHECFLWAEDFCNECRRYEEEENE